MLLWFESNGSHRHMRVTPSSLPELVAARKKLRAALRVRRRQLPPAERAALSQLVARNVDRWLRLRPGWRIAAYAALPEELDSRPLLDLAAHRGCRIYLPRIDRQALGRGMQFIAMNPRQRANRLGIAEPEGSLAIGARWLDVVFLPLVGFDARGLRLGSGGGYYDRAFAFRRWRTAWHAPRLIGLAYSFQQVDALVRAAHDVLMDAVITEKGAIRCSTG